MNIILQGTSIHSFYVYKQSAMVPNPLDDPQLVEAPQFLLTLYLEIPLSVKSLLRQTNFEELNVIIVIRLLSMSPLLQKLH